MMYDVCMAYAYSYKNREAISRNGGSNGGSGAVMKKENESDVEKGLHP